MKNLGQLIKNSEGYGIKLERLYSHPVQKVWDALTTPEKVSLWFTDVKWDFKPGGRITFIFQDEERTESYGHIVTLQPPHLFEFIWESGDESPDELARWELFEEGENKTKLVLTYTRITESLAINVATGWHVVLDDFEAFLGGKTEFPPFGQGGLNEEGEALKKEYEKQFNQLNKIKMETATAKPLVLERTYNAPAQKVWEAITDAGKMRKWYFDIEDFKPEVGFRFEFWANCESDHRYLHSCEVTEAEPGRKLTYSWRYSDYEGMSYVTWELFPEGEDTRLVLTHKGLETFPKTDKNFSRDSFTGGWTYFLETALNDFLEKGKN